MKNIKNVILLAFCLSLTVPTVYAGVDPYDNNPPDPTTPE